MDQMDQLKDEFLDHCIYVRRLSENTYRCYEYDLRLFFNFLKSFFPAIDKLGDITKDQLEAYLIHLNQEAKTTTVNRKFACLSAFFNYLEYKEHIEKNPMRVFPLNLRVIPPAPNTISIKEVEKLLRYLDSLPSNGRTSVAVKLRDIAIVELLFGLGLRVSELTSLSLKNYNSVNNSFRVLGKGSKERFAYLTEPQSIEAFENWLTIRESLKPKAEAIFLNKHGGPISPITIRGLLARHGKNAGIEHKLTPHSFRHCFASSLLSQDVDSKYIQELLGHSSIVTTQKYLHTQEEKKVALLKKAHPRKNIST